MYLSPTHVAYAAIRSKTLVLLLLIHCLFLLSLYGFLFSPCFVIQYFVLYPCADPESFVRGGPPLTTFCF